ncbi:MarR family transcriptional regulator [Paenibacillus macerans]|nr:MarR family transcriptional regulator [Paenibacillus macerans]
MTKDFGTFFISSRGENMSDNKPDLYEQYVRLVWLERRHQLQKLKEMGPMANPHQGQGRVLALLKLKPEMTQKELSAILDIRSQSLGELLAKLERSGYITRTPSKADRRVMEIRLTEAGRIAAKQNEEQSDSEIIFGCLNETEQAALSGYFTRIIEELEKEFGDDDSDLGSRDLRGSKQRR